jgi:long-chain acyl-CoA synthetase
VTEYNGQAGRPWLRWYAPGVPELVHVPDIALTQLLYDAAHDFPRRTALVFLGRTMTYNALVEAVEKFAAGLHQLGVRKGDRVALILPNCPQNVIAFFAVLRLGGVVVQHNPLYTPSEFAHQLTDSGATVAIVYDGAYARLAAARSATPLQHVIVTSFADYLPSGKRLALRLPFAGVREKREQLVADLPPNANVVQFSALLRHASGPPPPDPAGPDDLALLQYTGGTTGMPKGAMLTHRNLVANAYQASAWDPDMRRGNETFLAVLPMFHVYGLTMCLTVNMLVAGTLVLLPTFDLGLVFKAIDKWKPTVFPGVPPMYDQIVRSRRTSKHDLRSIRTCVSGAMRLPPETVAGFETVTGGHLVEGYGLTESSPVALANPLNDAARPGTIGLPMPSTDLRLANLDDPTHDVPIGYAGELCVRGPQVFAGYWQQPEESAAMLHDGWLHTGDIAVMDPDGFFTIVDRKRDVILASGFSIFPSEVEEVLSEHPAVLECAVTGVSHFYRGETVKAFVILHEGKDVDEDELRSFCAARLVAYKVPTRIEFRTELPHNLLGKVLRRVLRAEDEAARGRPLWTSPDLFAVADPSDRASAARHARPPQVAGPGGVDGVNGAHRVTPSGSPDLIEALERLSRLRESGALSTVEFEAAKARLLH